MLPRKLYNTEDTQVSVFELSSNSTAVVGIFRTKHTSALGACRIGNYETSDLAVTEAVKLAKALAYKCAVAGLPCGGASLVLASKASGDDRLVLFKEVSQILNSFNGKLIVAGDIGTTPADMKTVRSNSPWVVSESHALDRSANTAAGVIAGMKVAARRFHLNPELRGVTVAVQGLGTVGYRLVARLHAMGAKLKVTALTRQSLEKAATDFGAEVIPNSEIYRAECDIFSPCALGGIINPANIDLLRCKVVAGSANAQLADPDCANLLATKGILYLPDFVLNAGGLITAYSGLTGLEQPEIDSKIAALGDTIEDILHLAELDKATPYRVATVLAERRLAHEHR